MAKIKNAWAPKDGKVSRPGVHAKSKSSNHKSSKNYNKSYNGQGR